jgi:hypothetical protein
VHPAETPLAGGAGVGDTAHGGHAAWRPPQLAVAPLTVQVNVVCDPKSIAGGEPSAHVRVVSVPSVNPDKPGADHKSQPGIVGTMGAHV